MENKTTPILCDGCARPATPEHIAVRLARLERATRFRPVHMNILFLALAPMTRPEDDFYGPPQSNPIFDSLMAALEIPVHASDRSVNLTDFQKRGCYLSCVSECPLPDETPEIAAAISALSPALLRRIRFNYKPKHIALLGSELSPLIDLLEKTGLGPLLVRDRDTSASFPVTPGLPSGSGLRYALRTALSTGATA